MTGRSKKVWLVLSMGLFFLLSIPKARAQYDEANVSYNDFYENLSPYGQWIEDPQYGYVWSPDVDANFRPYYTNGHWVMTDYGNTWVSDYPWGWAPFHYGRWTYDSYYGWLWIPGSNWGPAWVSWRYGEGYYGWAPLGPEYAFKGDYYCPNDWWIFIPPQYLYTGNYYRYWYGPRGNRRILSNTVFMNNTYVNHHTTYVAGPHASHIQQITNRPVQTLRMKNSTNLNTRIHNDEIRMYRPAEIRPAASIGSRRFTPPNVVKAPQQIGKPQPVNTTNVTTTPFRESLPRNRNANDAIGTHFNEPPRATPKAREVTNPYEWDVNRPARQPQQEHERAPQQPREEIIQQPTRQPEQHNQPEQSNEPRRTPDQPRPGGRR